MLILTSCVILLQTQWLLGKGDDVVQSLGDYLGIQFRCDPTSSSPTLKACPGCSPNPDCDAIERATWWELRKRGRYLTRWWRTGWAFLCPSLPSKWSKMVLQHLMEATHDASIIQGSVFDGSFTLGHAFLFVNVQRAIPPSEGPGTAR